jgi:hypothetical protein
MRKGCDLMPVKALRTALATITILITVLLLILLAVTIIQAGAADAGKAVLTQAPADEPYLLRSYNGHVAVFFDRDDTTPGIETTIVTETLRSVDAEKLQDGIEAATYEDVLKLLEDFGS